MTENSQGPRQTLAMRLAERQRQRDLRAERLARLRTVAPDTAPEIETAPFSLVGASIGASTTHAARQDFPEDAPEDAEAALEEFLRALTGGVSGGVSGGLSGAPPPRPEPGAVLHFQRPATPEAASVPGDLDRLPGAGPGLVRALERAGFRRLADLAALEPDDLAERLGPLGLLVPARTWIDAAKAAPPA